MCNWQPGEEVKKEAEKIFEDILGKNYEHRIENSKIHPRLQNQLFFDKDTESYKMRKGKPFQQLWQDSWMSIWKKFINLKPYHSKPLIHRSRIKMIKFQKIIQEDIQTTQS